MAYWKWFTDPCRDGLFSKSFRGEGYFMIYLYMIMSTWGAYKIVVNYFKPKASNNKK